MQELAQSYKSPTAKNQQLRGKEIRLEAQVKDLETTNKTLGEKYIDAKRQLEEKDAAIAAIKKLKGEVARLHASETHYKKECVTWKERCTSAREEIQK